MSGPDWQDPASVRGAILEQALRMVPTAPGPVREAWASRIAALSDPAAVYTPGPDEVGDEPFVRAWYGLNERIAAAVLRGDARALLACGLRARRLCDRYRHTRSDPVRDAVGPAPVDLAADVVELLVALLVALLAEVDRARARHVPKPSFVARRRPRQATGPYAHAPPTSTAQGAPSGPRCACGRSRRRNVPI